jgi:hypothetical protein
MSYESTHAGTPQYSLTIDVPDIFTGTLLDWEEYFFKFANTDSIGTCLEAILLYCRNMGWECEVTYTHAL